ncbi:MAG: amidohydrolase [Candidatus Latescibacterota bacterium]|nr:MAG: amidohydrolase [Candidatus Latescibacterota bacterium]
MERMRAALSALLFASVAAHAAGAEAPNFRELARRHEAEAIADRRWFHERPELAMRERETAARLREILAAVPGIEIVEGEWGTGVVAILRGGLPGPLVAWRADIDALPIAEETGLPFASTRTDTLGGRTIGLMHACGHDIHMSVALGAARALSDARLAMPGSVLFVFQPAEETGEGAAAMIEAGVFAGDRLPECVLALHDHPTLRVGQVGSSAGWSSANVDAFRLTVKGKGGHGAYPHETIDPVTLASRMVLAFNDIVAREVDPNKPAVISIGSIHGGSKSSAIPDEVVLSATVRTRDEETRLAVKQKIERTATGLASAAGAPAPLVDYFLGTPSGYNDPALVEEVREVFRRVVGPENDLEYPPGMGGEDFSLYGRIVPGFQFRLGVASDGAPTNLHSATFGPDERAIAIGIEVTSEVLWDQLVRRSARRP